MAVFLENGAKTNDPGRILEGSGRILEVPGRHPEVPGCILQGWSCNLFDRGSVKCDRCDDSGDRGCAPESRGFNPGGRGCGTRREARRQQGWR